VPHPLRLFLIRLLALCNYPPVLINYLLHNNDKFPHELAIAAIMKNEGPYLREWIEYHKLVGVEKFYLYDNESTDNTKEVLAPYIQNGTVEYTYFHGKGFLTQTKAYANAVRRFKNKVKWLAVIDLDEFIVPVSKPKIIDVVNEFQDKLWKTKRKRLFGFSIHWVLYGYGGHREKPDGLVIENFRKSGGANVCIKTISNPRAAFFLSPLSLHTPIYLDLAFGFTETAEGFPWSATISVNTIRVNHYFTKSYEEYVQKLLRNKAWLPVHYRFDIPEYDPNYSSQYDDPIMDKYIALVKDKLEK
jgi:hypothetical protein